MPSAAPPPVNPAAQKPSRFFNRPLGCLAAIAIVCVWLIVAFVVGARALFFYEFDYEGSEVSLTIINHTAQPIQSADIFNFQNKAFVHLPAIPANGQQQGTGHFWSVEGPGQLTLLQGDKPRYLGLGCIFLNDNGPFDFTVTVDPDHVHVERWVQSKGSSAGDYMLSD